MQELHLLSVDIQLFSTFMLYKMPKTFRNFRKLVLKLIKVEKLLAYHNIRSIFF
jgi:hypothetical protein